MNPTRRPPARWAWLALALLLAACGGVSPSVTSVSVSLVSSALVVGETAQAEAQVVVVGGASTEVTWSSSDTLVATVDGEGLVTAVGAGSADIRATSTVNTSVSGSAGVTVSLAPAVTGLTIQGPPYLRIGRQASATAEIATEGGAGTGLVWSSSNDAVATVNGNGLITAVSAGTAFIEVASLFDDGFTAAYTIEVITEAWLDPGQDLPTPVGRPASVVVDGRFHVIGGEVLAGDRSAAIQLYDPMTESWDDGLDPMPVGLSNLCAASLHGSIYVSGGYDVDSTAVTTLYRFDLAEQAWEEMEDDPLPVGRYAHACAAHDGLLYLFGGQTEDGGGALEPWVYDPAAPAGGRWTTGLAAPPTDMRYAAAVPEGEHIYFGGGISMDSLGNLDAVSRYHPASDSWDALPPLQTARGGAGAWSDGRYLYLAAGGWSSYLVTIEAYDLEQGLLGSWVYTEPLALGRRTFAYGYDPEAQLAYVAAGWSGGFMADLEIGRDLAPEP